jgi:hypothetical protein
MPLHPMFAGMVTEIFLIDGFGVISRDFDLPKHENLV